MTDERNKDGSDAQDVVSRDQTLEADGLVEEVGDDEVVEDETVDDDAELDAPTEPYAPKAPPPLPPRRALTGRTLVWGALVVVLGVALAVVAGQWLVPAESPRAAEAEGEDVRPVPSGEGEDEEDTVRLDPVVIGGSGEDEAGEVE